MRFLEANEIAQWCEEHRISVDDDGNPRQSADVLDRITFAEGRRSGREAAVAARCLGQLGPWNECLLFVRQTGIWPSSEDWPGYYAARGSHGERRSLEVAPGHLFGKHEQVELTRFLTMAMEN